MATTKQKLLLQHPFHRHPLELLDLSNETGTLSCYLCHRKISVEAYTCQSCSSFLEDEIYYSCPSCEFFVHVGCAFKVVTYWEEGMSAKIELSWHKHPLLLCHRTESALNVCFHCWDVSIGPTYVCKEKDCGLQYQKRFTVIESTITHPHHPDHPLTLCERDYTDDCRSNCEACGKITDVLMFSCKLCLVHFHVKCAARFPTHKHYLHEHKLLRLEEHPYLECNRCGRSTDSPLFLCVPCNFNLHEECMKLPQVVKHDIHVHPLTLRETYVEDDSGEYYCDLCAERRDGRLGVYVCEQCKVTWAFHIECVLPELQNVYSKEHNATAIQRLAHEIARREEMVHVTERKLDEMKQELDELRKKHEALTLE